MEFPGSETGARIDWKCERSTATRISVHGVEIGKLRGSIRVQNRSCAVEVRKVESRHGSVSVIASL